MKRAELLERIGAAHARLARALEGLSEEESARVGLTAKWSVRDALAHIAAWEQEGARVLRGIADGSVRPRRYPDEEIERFNEEAVAARRGRSLAELVAEAEEAHAAMLAAARLLPEEVDEGSPAYRVADAFTIQHMGHHAGQIEKWRGTAE
jgi:uncharacterized protein (TIGR03083 family)